MLRLGVVLLDLLFGLAGITDPTELKHSLLNGLPQLRRLIITGSELSDLIP